MDVFKKIFCFHNWFIHDKNVYKWKETEVVKDTKHWYKPMLETYDYEETVEILICKKCGKIEKIEY